MAEQNLTNPTQEPTTTTAAEAALAEAEARAAAAEAALAAAKAKAAQAALAQARAQAAAAKAAEPTAALAEPTPAPATAEPEPKAAPATAEAQAEPTAEAPDKKSALGVIKTVFTLLIVLISVGMMIFTIVSVRTFNRTDRKLFGYGVYIVLSDSMSATDFNAGDLVFTKPVDPSTLREGDIIAFISTNEESYGSVVTHKIRSLTYDQNGNPGFVTYGTTTDTDDAEIVTYMNVLGQYQFALPKVGSFFTFMRTVPGYIVCILTPFLILIVIQALDAIRLFRLYKKEQMEEVEREREALRLERERSEAMMSELLALKASMTNATPSGGADRETGA